MRSTLDADITLLLEGTTLPMTTQEIVQKLGRSNSSVCNHLRKLVATGKVNCVTNFNGDMRAKWYTLVRGNNANG
jgi:predicted transcriptional regulator